jgi:hypothetical protein
MKVLLLLGACVGALAMTAAAGAQPPQPSGFGATVESPPVVTKLTTAQAKALGVPAQLAPGARTGLKQIDAGIAAPNGGCGACINSCWTANYRIGGDTSTGSYFENFQPLWCGNGAWITYLDMSRHWQTVSMWYSADGEAGPWVDGGCVGCTSIRPVVYGYFTWHPVILPASHTTIRLAVWLQAYGSAAWG